MGRLSTGWSVIGGSLRSPAAEAKARGGQREMVLGKGWALRGANSDDVARPIEFERVGSTK